MQTGNITSSSGASTSRRQDRSGDRPPLNFSFFSKQPIINDLTRKASIQSSKSETLFQNLQSFATELQKKCDVSLSGDRKLKLLSGWEKEKFLKGMQKKIRESNALHQQEPKPKKKKSIVPKKQTPYDIAMQLAPYVLMSVSATGLAILGLLELNDRQNQ